MDGVTRGYPSNQPTVITKRDRSQGQHRQNSAFLPLNRIYSRPGSFRGGKEFGGSRVLRISFIEKFIKGIFHLSTKACSTIPLRSR